MIHLTNDTTAPQGCEPRLYPYWTQINHHAGQDHLFAFVGRVGLHPLLLTIRKADLAVLETRDLPFAGTGEGWYFSDTQPHALYVLLARSLMRYDVVTDQVETVFTLNVAFGSTLWQAHSSADDRVHSATVKGADYEDVGCVVSREGQQQFFGAHEGYDECQIDKSGRFLVIKEGLGANRIVDLVTGNESTITDMDGAVGHSDCGDGTLIGEDDSSDRWQLVRWNLAHLDGGMQVLLRGPAEWRNGMGHCAVRGDRVLVSGDDGIYAVEPSGEILPVAPPQMWATDYDHQLRACWDPTGEYCLWLADSGTGRFDAFMARVGDAVSVQPSGGSVMQFGIFTQPEDDGAPHLHTDGPEPSPRDYDATPGSKDGRPAWIFEIDANTPNGHGADLSFTYKDGSTLSYHGLLRTSPVVEFLPDVYRKPVRP